MSQSDLSKFYGRFLAIKDINSFLKKCDRTHKTSSVKKKIRNFIRFIKM